MVQHRMSGEPKISDSIPLYNFEDNEKFKLLRLIAKASSQEKCEGRGRHPRDAWADLEIRLYSALKTEPYHWLLHDRII